MSDIDNNDTKVSRRQVFGLSSAAITAATLAAVGGKSVDGQTRLMANHTAPNESDPGQQNLPLAAENPDSEWSPPTDSGKRTVALAPKVP